MKRDGDDLFDHCRHTLEKLGAGKGTLALIFNNSPWTKMLWIYDLRTNKHYTLKTSPMKREDLDEFVACYNPSNRHERKSTWSAENPDGRWRAYDYDELIARDKASLDIFWLGDDALADSDNLQPPEVIAQEIVDDLEAALEQVSPDCGRSGIAAGGSKLSCNGRSACSPMAEVSWKTCQFQHVRMAERQAACGLRVFNV